MKKRTFLNILNFQLKPEITTAKGMVKLGLIRSRKFFFKIYFILISLSTENLLSTYAATFFDFCPYF